jgi:hypothetical protein
MAGSNEYLFKMAETVNQLTASAKEKPLHVTHGEFDHRMDGNRPPCPTCRRKFVDDEKVTIVYTKSTPPSGDMFHQKCTPLLDTLVDREEAVDRVMDRIEDAAAAVTHTEGVPTPTVEQITDAIKALREITGREQLPLPIVHRDPIRPIGMGRERQFEKDALSMKRGRWLADKAALEQNRIVMHASADAGPAKKFTPPGLPTLEMIAEPPQGVKPPATITLRAVYVAGTRWGDVCCQCEGPFAAGEVVSLDGNDSGYRLIHTRCVDASNAGGENPAPPQK